MTDFQAAVIAENERDCDLDIYLENNSAEVEQAITDIFGSELYAISERINKIVDEVQKAFPREDVKDQIYEISKHS